MKQKKWGKGFALLIACILCVLSAVAEAATVSEINTSEFSRKSVLHFFDDGTWSYFGHCSPVDLDLLYEIDMDIHCWGDKLLTCYPYLSVNIINVEEDEHIVANKITVCFEKRRYEFQLLNGKFPSVNDIPAGVTFLFPSDQAFIEDCASSKECTIIAETDIGSFTWFVPEDDYSYQMLPFAQDMLRFDFLNNVEQNETTAVQIELSPEKRVYDVVDDSSSELNQDDDYSFSEDSTAISKAANSVFYVEMYDEEKNCLGNASGFVSFDEHYFVTNEHVVDGAAYLVAWDINDKSYLLNKVIAIDNDHDIAILEFAEGAKYTSLKLDTEDNLKRGMPVVAIGSKGLQVAYSTGVIGAFPELEQYSGVKCIQYSAPTYRESNGGCLLGDNGKVIGITSAISSDGQYIGVAVPSKYLVNLYSRMKSNVYNVMDTSGSGNSDTLAENGKKKEDPTIITGGKINTIVAISNDIDLEPYIMDSFDMTVREFFDRYDQVRKTTVKDAPAIKNRTLGDNKCFDCDADAGIGTRIYCKHDQASNSSDLDIPITGILQFGKLRFHDSDLTANTRACLAVFSGDTHLLDKLEDFYSRYDCSSNQCRPGLLTSEGYLIVYNEWDLNVMIYIYNAAR